MKPLSPALTLAGNGTGGDAYSYMCDMNKLAKRNNATKKVVTVGPQRGTYRPILN